MKKEKQKKEKTADSTEKKLANTRGDVEDDSET